jgi:hypothetical protein
VIELANEQMPILQEKTQNALSHAAGASFLRPALLSILASRPWQLVCEAVVTER